MNVFVLCTGRCGSKTFIEACRYITNYSCAHESRSALIGKARLDYPRNHIEADNRLSWLLGRLDRTYGGDAFYVHLKRNESDAARSFARRCSRGIMRAYARGILTGRRRRRDPLSVAEDYCRTVNANIELFLRDKPQRMTVTLGSLRQGFAAFWRRIRAEGDYAAALAELEVVHNAAHRSGRAKRRRDASGA